MGNQLLCHPVDLEWAELMKPKYESDLGRKLEIWVHEDCPPGLLFAPENDIHMDGLRKPAT